MKKEYKIYIIVIIILIAVAIFVSLISLRKIELFKSKENTGSIGENVIEKNNVEVFKVENNSDETKTINFCYKDSDDHGELIIPIDVSNCTGDINYKIIIDVSSIYQKYDEYSAVHFDDLDVVDGQVVKEGTIKLDSLDNAMTDVIFYWRSYMRSRADYSQNEINETISIRVITSTIE